MKQVGASKALAVTALFLAVLLLGSGCGDNASTLTVVSVTEDITAPATWTHTNLYRLEKSITVSAALTIEPGTIIKLEQGLSITVGANGSILADAASAATPCRFTSIKDDASGGDTNGDGAATAPAPGDWGYLSVTADGSVFNHCQFLYGGSAMPYTGTLTIKNVAAVTVKNCVFAHNQGGRPADTRAAAFNAGSAGTGTVITGNTFYNNDLPLVINGSFDLDDSNRFHQQVGTSVIGNQYNGIFWGGSYQTSGDVSWTNTDVPYVIINNPLGVAASSTLTLGDGVIIKFDQGQRIDVSGTLIADAVTDILFTSLRDDTRGGDTNGDGALTVAAPGDWAFVKLSGDGSILDRCRFSYGGSAKPYSGTVAVTNGRAATITNCTFAHNAGGTLTDHRAAALNLGGAAAGTVITGNMFYDNDLPLVINGLVSIDGTNTFHGGTPEVANKYNGIFLDGVAHTVSDSVTWSNTEVAYVIDNGTVLSIALGASLTLGDNVVLKLGPGRIDLMGNLQQGTADTFTSIKDDLHAGDTNGDGAATTPATGDWAGINLCGSGCAYAAWGNILYAANP